MCVLCVCVVGQLKGLAEEGCAEEAPKTTGDGATQAYHRSRCPVKPNAEGGSAHLGQGGERCTHGKKVRDYSGLNSPFLR